MPFIYYLSYDFPLVVNVQAAEEQTKRWIKNNFIAPSTHFYLPRNNIWYIFPPVNPHHLARLSYPILSCIIWSIIWLQLLILLHYFFYLYCFYCIIIGGKGKIYI